jgi:uncharacterized protein
LAHDIDSRPDDPRQGAGLTGIGPPDRTMGDGTARSPGPLGRLARIPGWMPILLVAGALLGIGIATGSAPVDGAGLVLLIAAGFAGGGANAIAGGGTFFTFPALLSVGLPPVVANASNAVAIWPGHAAGVLPYGREIRRLRSRLVRSCAAALLGGIVGAALLLASGDAVFRSLVPWLLLLATLLFAFSARISRWAAAIRSSAEGRSGLPAAFAIEFLVSIYGGYFGAGLGVMMMATLSLTGIRDIHEINALKNLLASAVSSVAVVIFVAAGAVRWPEALAVMAGAVLGGYAGAVMARRIPVAWLRATIIAIGFLLSAYYLTA